MSVPNQKTIYIERTSEKSQKDYFKVSNENLYEAMYNLKPTTFLLWVYLTDNSNGYRVDLYPIDFISKSGVSRSTYDRAFEELEKKGYLEKSKKAKNTYIFVEKSDSEYIRSVDLVRSTNNLEEIREKLF